MDTRKSGKNFSFVVWQACSFFFFIPSVTRTCHFYQKCKSDNCLDRCTFYTRRSRSIEYTGLRHSVSYGDACVDTKVWKDTVEFAGVPIPHSYFGVANRMNGFDHGFGKRSWKPHLRRKEKVLLILRPCLLKPLLNHPSDKQMGILASALPSNLAMESSIQQPLLVGTISMVYGGCFGRSSWY